jgi:hypothetical protein
MIIRSLLPLLLLFAFLSAPSAYAQSNWRKNAKEAEALLKTGQSEQAGALFYAAWESKPAKKDLAYQAGKAFAASKNYTRAAESFEKALGKPKSFPLAGLEYARSLKQCGKYDEASKAFSDFIGSYKGEDLDKIAQIVETEIRGCELGSSATANLESSGISIELLGPNINSRATEFAPIPFNEEILYFSSTRDGRAQIYRSQNEQGAWSTGSLSTNFPEIEKDHFCNGSLTPDNKRFYFTICKTVEKKGIPTTRCEIYVIKRQGNTWSLPERLRDYVNLEEATTTHPYVIFNGTTEIVYFTSDRPGGFGGMDIWYITRDINSKEFDFTYPVNCGSAINTPMDEVTPYYDLEEATLYFSSNGHVSMGGFDILQASGSRSQWKAPDNAGAPFNSPADDYYFIRSPSKRMGFFVSNREFPPAKSTTTDEDIFQYFYEMPALADDYPLVSGFVYDQMTGEVLSDVEVAVYEITEMGEKFLAGKDKFSDGNYSFSLLNDRNYEIIARKNGYESGAITLDTGGPRPSEKGYSTPIFLNNTSRPAPPPRPTDKPREEEPATTGASYRVQVSAVRQYEAPRFSALQEVGIIQTEEIEGRGLTRVLVGNFATMEEAESARSTVIRKGFKGAIIVLYENGKRIRTFE